MIRGSRVEAESEARIEGGVRDALDAAGGLSILKEPAIAGVRPDYLAQTEDGRRLVVELKAADAPGALAIVQARAEAALLADAVGADRGVAVFAAEHLIHVTDDAVGVADLPAALDAWRRAPRRRVTMAPVQEDANRIFVAMPFAPKYDDTYFVAMLGAAHDVGAACQRLDQEQYVGEVMPKLRELIEGADVVIADLSGANPNVLYEVGFAHALSRATVHICSSPLDELPFDVRGWNTLSYQLGQTHALRDELTRRLARIMAPA